MHVCVNIFLLQSLYFRCQTNTFGCLVWLCSMHINRSIVNNNTNVFCDLYKERCSDWNVLQNCIGVIKLSTIYIITNITNTPGNRLYSLYTCTNIRRFSASAYNLLHTWQTLKHTPVVYEEQNRISLIEKTIDD